MKFLKIALVVIVAVVVTTLGIDASDTLQGKGGTMLGQLIGSDGGVCPKGMVQIESGTSFTCADVYEASWGEECELVSVSNQMDSANALKNSDCKAESKIDTTPWSFVTREQASLACVRAGKRLPNAKEWYELAMGTPDDPTLCGLDTGNLSKTGLYQSCISATGIHDAVGNVWEWVSDDVIDGTYAGRKLPEKGYVNQVDSGGVATVTSDDSNELFGADYFWTSEEGAFGILRGGYFGSKVDGGVYAFHAKTLPTTAIGSIGFRCVK